jgi:NADH dehydrogenase
VNTNPHTVALTGCTGFVGRSLTRELLSRGHAVRGLVRSSAKAREVFGPRPPAGLSFITGDVGDRDALDALLAGASAAINLIGIIREVRTPDRAERSQTFDRMHVRVARDLTDGCARHNVRRYLQMSALSVGPEGRSMYQKTKWEAEQVVRHSPLDWTIFRPGLIHGPDGELMQILAELASGEAPPYIFMPYFARTRIDHRVPIGAMTFEPAQVQPIAVEDVAFAFAQALATPAAIGEIYNLVGPEVLDWRELSEFIRDTLPGTKKEMGVWYIPGDHAAHIARCADKIGLGRLLPFDEGQAMMATQDTTADTTKARVDLGLTPRPFRESVRAYAAAV